MHLLTTEYVDSGRCVSAIGTVRSGLTVVSFHLSAFTHRRFRAARVGETESASYLDPFLELRDHSPLNLLTTGYVDSGWCISAIGTVKIGLTAVPFGLSAFTHRRFCAARVGVTESARVGVTESASYLDLFS